MPWCVILGNHDCMIDPEAQVGRCGAAMIPRPPTPPSISGAQVAYTAVDPRGLWRMPARTYGFTCGGASFFGLDTCGCQHSVQRADPASVERLDRDIAALGVALAAADPTKPKVLNCAGPLVASHLSTPALAPRSISLPLQVVFGHHTLYTKGLGHLDEAKCLRLPSYSFRPPVRTQREREGRGGGGVGGLLAAPHCHS